MKMNSEDCAMTPAALQKRADLSRRRWIAAGLNCGVYLALLGWLASLFQQAGWTVIEGMIFIAFAIAAPWNVLGVCNALIGLWLTHICRDGLARAAPHAIYDANPTPLRGKTAIVMTLRHEDVARAFARLMAMKKTVDMTGEGAQFGWFVLSDTTEHEFALKEEAAFAAWIAAAGPSATQLHYRRRAQNTGYKAGNIRDFCENFGAGFTFMILLDADSLMDGETILRLVRIGEAAPKLGILQSLVVGAPATSAFARIFQFGMRHGMRTYTLGATWWAGDCGPFWGHNALVRIAPYMESCALPVLKGGHHILSHDQIEAVLMRRAGFEVRVLPVEGGSYEDNPPNLVEFTQRDLRWCRGNLQYVQLLNMPGLLPMSRFQMIWAISMFAGLPAWTAIILLIALMPLTQTNIYAFPVLSAGTFYILFLSFHLAPKLAGFLDVVLTPGGLKRYGGSGRFAADCCIELIASFLIGAATSLRTSLFMLGLMFGRTIGWDPQMRDAKALSWQNAAAVFWPQTLLGLILFGIGAVCSPFLLLWSLPLTFGYLTAIPFAKVTASPTLGVWFTRAGLCSIPEERVGSPLFADLI